MIHPPNVFVLAESAHHAVPAGWTWLFAFVLLGMIASLALEEKLHAKKSVIVGVFAVGSLLLGAVAGILPFEDASHMKLGGHEIAMPVYIPAIDWGVIAIILGSSLFVDVTSRSGLFTWIAIRLTKASGGDPLKLLWFYGGMTVVFSALLNNVTAMIIVGSLTVVSLNRLERRDKLLGFLMVEGLLTNIGGLLTLISSVPNIIVGNAAGISFVAFFLQAAIYVVIATGLTVWLGANVFGIQKLTSHSEIAAAREQVAGFDENDGVDSPFFFWFGAAMLGLFIVTIALASVEADWNVLNNLGMGFVALSFGAVMLVRFKAIADQFYKALDWDLLAFFAGLFVVINVMEHALVLEGIGGMLRPILSLGDSAGPAAMLVSSAVASSVTDNIPLAAMLAKILAATPAELQIAGNPGSPFWWAVIFGANLGGNLTPIGSASTLVAVTIMHKHGVPMSFVGFVKKAAMFAAAQIFLAVLYVLLILPLFG